MGISDPSDIDLDAIAWTMRASVRYRALHGCEARIVGKSDEAIISVNSRSRMTRRRFSLAHELGHWHHHRGQMLFCRSSEIGGGRGNSQVEKVANRFAAGLLMPGFLFDPRAAGLAKMNFTTLAGLADEFQVSRIAASIRAVERGHVAALLVCHGSAGLRWFVRSPLVPETWWPKKELRPESMAFSIQFGGQMRDGKSQKVNAGHWFQGRNFEQFEIREETIRSHGETLTLLTIDDQRMLAQA